MPPPPQVSAITVHKNEVPIVYEYAGRVAAFKETEVRARVGGILLHRNFVEGTRVNQGDLLFEIDPAPYEAEVARQAALVAQAQATYDQSERDVKRAGQLLQQQVQSKALYDQTVARRDANAATLQQMQAALRTAQLNLEYTKVTAPISGTTSREAVSEGSLIGVDPSSSLLTTITQSDPVYVNFSYTDVEAQKIRELMNAMNARGEKVDELKVRIHFGDGRDYNKLGTIDFTSSTLDALTGTLGVRAVVDNPDDVLVPGQFVRITVTGLKLDQAVVIPEAALLQDSTGTFVYVVDSEKNIEKRPVTVVRQLEDRSWLLADSRVIDEKGSAGSNPVSDTAAAPSAPSDEKYVGLNGGDVVITEGHFRIGAALGQLPPGMKLKVAVTTLDGKNIDRPQSGAGEAETAK